MNTPANYMISAHLIRIYLDDVILTHGLKQVLSFTRHTPLLQVNSPKLRLQKGRKNLKDIKDNGKGTSEKAGTLTRGKGERWGTAKGSRAKRAGAGKGGGITEGERKETAEGGIAERSLARRKAGLLRGTGRKAGSLREAVREPGGKGRQNP